ncbi:MAG: MBOAT family protein [Lachnospiraceae bacterium]|nr:MBOAT family protein [Lachnospiraceae bacterium]
MRQSSTGREDEVQQASPGGRNEERQAPPGRNARVSDQNRSDEGEQSSSSGLLYGAQDRAGAEGAASGFCSFDYKNILLLAASLFFYAYGEPVYVFLMILSAVLNYFWARLMERFPNGRRQVMLLAVLQNLGVLGVFKYAGFLAELWNALGLIQVPVPAIDLPIGISFFTFQALSYVIDVYREDVKAERSPFRLMLYISFFPQLIAGPIVKYHDIADELKNRQLTLDGMVFGIRRFVTGLAKKVLIANYMGAVADTLFDAGMSEINVLGAWVGAIAYMLQIYFDFGGYSDMAIGLGAMFGFHFKENFRYPYAASSMKEFWRRWHISLSTWFREYLYIPLGGNRKGKLRTGINKVIVFACTGIWHGAKLTFLFWGLYHGFFLLLEEWLPMLKDRLCGGKKESREGRMEAEGSLRGRESARERGMTGDARMEAESSLLDGKASDGDSAAEKTRLGMHFLKKLLGHLYVLLAVLVGFVFFRADSMQAGVLWVKTMFTGFTFDNASMRLVMAQLTPLNLTVFFAGVIASAPILRKLEGRRLFQVLSWPLTIVLLILCMLSLAGGTYNAFIYFRF